MPRYVSSYFSPNRGTIDVLIGFIDRCEKTIDAAVYSLTHDDVAAALIRAHERGVKIRLLVDNLQASSRYSDDDLLREHNIEVREDNSSGYLHHKFIIGDSNAVGTGSYNWTKSAETRNAENFMIVRLQYAVDEFQSEFEHLWERFAPVIPE